jgi:hypothetical protein
MPGFQLIAEGCASGARFMLAVRHGGDASPLLGHIVDCGLGLPTH